MSELEKLRKEFEEKKKRLQESCPHPSKTDWIDYWWAIAHSTGSAVRSCTRCGKILETKTHEELRKELPMEKLPNFLLPFEVRLAIYKLITKDTKWKEARNQYFKSLQSLNNSSALRQR